MPSILLASSNPHKVVEVRDMLAPTGVSMVSLDEIDIEVEEPEEDGDTFEANARIKATAYARATGRVCLADDSGLEVDALGGAPGVHSARYAGTEGDRTARDERNNRKLLAEMADVPEGQRAARFVCAVCIANEAGAVLFEARGTFDGVIAFAPKGDNGFGYDPLLHIPELGQTSAELTSAAKNQRSHRGHAIRQVVVWLRDHASLLG